ncbi:YihY/virulence factor BrkB family protein [Aurantimonas sp. VKM B-3413]|uniref:YihY/virulence factor BrkB family protein n=1 Tax=Aurantimonas sp. VKM B-3413 TaxID=2779401 RepID=UPI001E63E9FA|nr:YihY/virulence factor BrkB family protein [Aurantimonas sp. VKM B-3413]MCB8839186.1 YihY/virulence factor BrkB family protein [Aurantimonas sp. VKM B-3413]
MPKSRARRPNDAGRGQTPRGGHGRDAVKPSEIPAAGWKSILWRVYAEIGDDRVMLVAAGVTYYLLLAMVPAMAAIMSVYGLFADASTVTDQLGQFGGVLPGGAMDILREQLTRLASSNNSTLGLSLFLSLAISLWSANSGVKALFEAMNVAYDEKEDRSFLMLNAISLLFTLCLVIAAILLVVLAVVLPNLLGTLGLGSAAQWTISAVSLIVTLLVISFGIAGLYRWGPNRANAQWRWITPGTALTVIVTAVVSVLFSWYTANFGSYNATYGSLGALIGFMTWIWLTMIVLIIGAELNSEMEHQTARDTTTGPTKPMGKRGALMADTVADDDSTTTRRDGGSRRSQQGRGDGDAARSSSGSPGSGNRREVGRPDRLSIGRLAFALPAALTLAYLQRRQRRG